VENIKRKTVNYAKEGGFKMNNKAAATDIIVYMVVVFVFVLFIGLWLYSIGIFTTAIRNNLGSFVNPQAGLDNSTVKNIFDSTVGSLPASYSSVKWLSFMIIVFEAFSLILGGLFVRIWKGFFPVYILLALICVVISVPLSNAYESVYYNTTFGPTFASLIGPSWILLHFPIWITVISLFAGIIMFISLPKPNSEFSGYGFGGSPI
jgi:hypothetical protein